MVITTEHLRIRAAVESDAALIAELWNNPVIMGHVGFPAGLQMETTRIAGLLSAKQHPLLDRILVAEHIVTGQVIGQAMMHSPDHEMICRTDIKIFPEFQGRRFGTEIKSALLNYLFVETAGIAVEATPNIDNTASIRLQESAGGIRIGRSRWEPEPGQHSKAVPVDSWIYRVYRNTAPYPDIRKRSLLYSGIVPASGLSTRMGRYKLLLPWPPGQSGTCCVIQSAIRSLMEAGVEPIVVPAGKHIRDLRNRLRHWPVTIIRGAPGEAPMSDTVAKAVPFIVSGSATLVLPADHPGIRSETIRLLISHHESNPGKIYLPQFQGRTGHPVLFPPVALKLIATPDLEEGLRTIIHSSGIDVVRKEYNDPGILKNLDYPTDYSLP